MDYFDQINAYISGEMTPEERSDFENQMVQNPQLKNDVEKEKLLVEGIFASGLRQEMKQLQQERGKEKPEAKVIQLGQWRQWAVAASIAALLGVFMWQYNSNLTETSVHFADIYHADPGLPVTMGNESSNRFNEAMVSYKDGAWEDARQTFEQLCQSDEIQLACYYVAMANIQNDNFVAAEDQLQKVLNKTSDDELRQKTEWHLAYVQYKLENHRYTGLIRQIASDAAHLYHEEAMKLLQK